MDFMNLNQSAHGDREFGFIGSRLRLERKVIVGYWQDEDVQTSLGAWARAACAWADWQGARVVRFGDNMREVAVTEGDKVEAQLPPGLRGQRLRRRRLVKYVNEVADADVDRLIGEYEERTGSRRSYWPAAPGTSSCATVPSMEIGIRRFLDSAAGFKAWTTTFEDLHGLDQLPGLAAQRLMADGYGYGGEGDWKTAALVRAMMVMASGLEGGTSFMEDYTYHLDPAGMKILGSHMLEDLRADRRGAAAPGGPPAGHRRQGRPGAAGVRRPQRPGGGRVHRGHGQPLPHGGQPGGRGADGRSRCQSCRWRGRSGCRSPTCKTATTAWILAGGAHHTGFSYALTAEHLEDFAEMAGIEFLLINQETKLAEFKKELRWNEVYYLIAKGF